MINLIIRDLFAMITSVPTSPLCLTGPYGPTVLNCGQYRPGGRGRTLVTDAWNSYRLFVVYGGTLNLEEAGAIERYPPGSACVIVPGARLRIRLAPQSAIAFVVFDVIHQPREGSSGRLQHVVPAARQPGPQQVWGCDPGRRVPDELGAGTVALIDQIRGRYWRGVLEHARASAHLALWLSEFLLAAEPEREDGEARGADPFEAAERHARRLAPRLPTVAELAAYCGMSREHFARAFKQARGLSPSAFLDNERWQQAQRLLTDGSDSLAKVAQQLRYTDPSAFSRAFRRRFGCSPRAYRRLYRIR